MRPANALQARWRCANNALLRIALLVTPLACIASAYNPTAAHAQVAFRRGDANQDTEVDLSDATSIFGWLFAGQEVGDCIDSLDGNDDGTIDLSDGLFLLNFLFSGGSPPAAPGTEQCGLDPTPDSLDCREYDLSLCDNTLAETLATGHVLNRVAYGPSPDDLEWIRDVGITSYLETQLTPESIDETDNIPLVARESELFGSIPFADDSTLIDFREEWRYRKGIAPPPFGWLRSSFNDSNWLLGLPPFGYGEPEVVTVLDDMPENYLTVYLRKVFVVDDPAAVETLIFRLIYDDGFVAYLNNAEIVRDNMAGLPGIAPAYTTPTIASRESGDLVEFDVSGHIDQLKPGENVLCIQMHNSGLDSTDLVCKPELVSRTVLGPARTAIRSHRALEQLPHVRGVYSRRQLQTVLAEFWDNHFTTDLDKVTDYFDTLQNVTAADAMPFAQASAEAAQVEYLEHQFFYENALGNFSDLLLYSATSPSMLIYLDNVLNHKAAPNENYAREFLELSTFGVDNRYTQTDIEELAKCFTGWNVCKIPPSEQQDFPFHATNPPVDCGPAVTESVLVPLGSTWHLFKGVREPSPNLLTGEPTTAWTAPIFDSSDVAVWAPVTTGIGYGDAGNATELDDMRNSYMSVYMRHEFPLANPASIGELILWIAYDDSYVAYLNGTEISRSAGLAPRFLSPRMPPTFDDFSSERHGVEEGPELVNITRFRGVLRTGTNVLAIQAHNRAVQSNDFSVRPRLLVRRIADEGLQPSNPLGVWAFRFDSTEHNLEPKRLFANTPYEIDIPGGRTGLAGVRDALDVVEAAADHPSTAEFICIKLIQRFVSDQISLALFKNAPETVPLELRSLLAEMIGAWNETTPKGNIGHVLRVLIDPVDHSSAFWTEIAYRSKVKTPVEFINSSLRAIDADIVGDSLPDRNTTMGMSLFTRDDPDGWSEIGVNWVDTSSLLARIEFVRALTGNADTNFGWDPIGYLNSRGLETPEQIVAFFDELLLEGTMHPSTRTLFIEFLTTDEADNPIGFSSLRQDFRSRVEAFVGILLSMPQWQFQ
jgi:hypothetical protein